MLRLNFPTCFHESEERDFVEYLEQEVEDYFVVEQDKKILAAGGINYFPDKAEARILWNIVHPHFHKRALKSL